MKRLLILLSIIIFTFIFVNAIFADEYDELQRDKDYKENILWEKEREEQETRSQQQSINKQISAVGSQQSAVSSQLINKTREIVELEKVRGTKQELRITNYELRNKLIANLYKKSKITPLILFFGQDSFEGFSQLFSYYQAILGKSKGQIQNLNHEITTLGMSIDEASSRKQQLEKDIEELRVRQSILQTKNQELSDFRFQLLEQITHLQGEIRNITARQEELIRQKMGATAFFTSVGDVEQARKALPDPPFSPAFVVFSFGYPHRVGMNQYGAFGRAKAGQNYQDILKAYYKNVEIVNYNCPQDITVDLGGRKKTINFEENYLFGIAEMPTKWANEGGYEALKAQAVAARTYALAVTNNGQSSICTTQACQVYLSSKVNNPDAGRWRDAVRDTRGQVIVYNGQPIKAWYSSTFGGFSRLATDFDVKWSYSPPYIQRIRDADSNGRFYDGPGSGDSPWFYKAWYDEASDGHPYLTEEEMKDLLNASLLPESYNEHLSREDQDGWSKDRVIEELNKLNIRPIGHVNGIQSVHSTEGYTYMIKIETDNGTREVDGKRFRLIFILRSRGKLALWSSLYDVVKK